MSSRNSKRKAESTTANRSTKSSRSERSLTSDYNWSSSTSLGSYIPWSHDTRFLKFELGASIEYKVLCAIAALATSKRLSICERVACIYDATEILNDTLRIPVSDRDQIVCEKDINDLHAALDAAKTCPDLVVSVRSRLQYYENMPFLPLNDVVLQEWHDEATTFIRHCTALVDRCDIEEVLHLSRTAIKKLYHRYLRHVEDENLILQKQPPIDEGNASPSGSFDSRIAYHMLDEQLYRTVRESLQVLRSKEPISQDLVCNKFQSIHKAYDALSLLLDENTVGKFDHFTIYELAQPCRLIGEGLTDLLSHTDLEDSLKAQYLERHPDVFCQGSRHKLVSRTKDVLRRQIEKKFHALQHSVDGKPTRLLENKFYHLAGLISIFAMKTPVGVVENDWVRYAPRMLTLEQSEVLMNKLQCLHTRFQDEVYNQTEESKLWLNIWRGLKAAYLILRENNFDFKIVAPMGFPAEITFFDRITLRNQFETILSGPEALHPHIIENVVGEYCILIDECRNSPESTYDLLRLFNTDVVIPMIFNKIKRLAKTRIWDDTALRGVQKCATRLNYITAGPTFIRRIDPRRETDEASWYNEWVAEKVMVNGETESHDYTLPTISAASAQPSVDDPLPVSRNYIMPQAVTTSTGDSSTANPFDNNVNEDPWSHADDEQNDIEPPLMKMHAVSAYDYAAYPFPETRALEVANSRQISRELSQPGIHSSGPLPEDVINRPPRHTWPPGTVSIWAKRLPIDPVSVAKDLWDTLRDKHPKRKQLKQPKPYPGITPRRPRKEWVDEHPRLRPLYDRKRRVAKHTRGEHDHDDHQSKNSQSEHSHQMRVPKLRGGGVRSHDAAPGPEDWPQTAPAPMSDATRALYEDMDYRTRKLATRLLGFWRGGDAPSDSLLREHFLIPNNWDVDAAHEAARRFVDYGLLEKTSQGIIDESDDSTQGMDGASCPHGPVNYTDPFVEFGVTPGKGLCRTKYGMPFCRPVALSGSHDDEHQPESIVSVKAVRQELGPSSPLQAHLLLGDDQGAILDSNCNVYSSADLPAAIQIGKKSSARVVLASQPPPASWPWDSSQPPSSYPPGNQEGVQQDPRHIPPTPGQGTPPPASSQTLPSQTQQPPAQLCDAHQCHPCPQYAGQFHHICRAQHQHDPDPDPDNLWGSQDFPPSSFLQNMSNNLARPYNLLLSGQPEFAANYGNDLPMFDYQQNVHDHIFPPGDEDHTGFWDQRVDDRSMRRAVRFASVSTTTTSPDKKMRKSSTTRRNSKRRDSHIHEHVEHVQHAPAAATDEVEIPEPSPVQEVQPPSPAESVESSGSSFNPSPSPSLTLSPSPTPSPTPTPTPTPSPTKVGGHNLRNRGRLDCRRDNWIARGRVAKRPVAKRARRART